MWAIGERCMGLACPLPLPNGLDRETHMPSLRHAQPNGMPLRVVRKMTAAEENENHVQGRLFSRLM